MIANGFIFVFLVLMLAGIPIAFALISGGISYFVLTEKLFFLQNLAQKIMGGVNQFPLLAIPLFVLAGELMNVGGITQRLVNFAHTCVGHWRGGLAQVGIMSNVMMAGLSGSAAADAAVLGGMLIPAMEKDGYPRAAAGSVIAASAIIGPIIPPSIICVLYAFIMQISVIGLFFACVVPGILIGVGLMVVTRLTAERRHFPAPGKRASWKERLKAMREAILPLLTPVIILRGTVSGYFTATEAAAVVVFYALLLGFVVYRNLPLKELPHIVFRATLSSATLLFIVAGAFVFAWAVTMSGLPGKLAHFATSVTDNKYIFLLCINIALLIVGMFLDAGPAVLIMAPILAPAAMQYGVDPSHFAIIMCVNLCVGLVTPPMGLVLFVTASVGKMGVPQICKEMVPYWILHGVILLAITYIPVLVLGFPRLCGVL